MFSTLCENYICNKFTKCIYRDECSPCFCPYVKEDLCDTCVFKTACSYNGKKRKKNESKL